jgi:predicted signal transduction protein with EAL and GGDEF domain
VALGRSLQLKVVAEGIERAEQEWELRNLGCDYGQGYLYSKPISTGDLANLLEIGDLGVSRPTQPTAAASPPSLPNRSLMAVPVA